ncbi:Rossmann-fold NAD(P)-binding domain-containing protein [Francisella philomiragia]|uniref:NAD(P)-dependent oxidoreductase n=1 Tax=Francisella philomiragia TaxID=28110 RepID=UPI0019032134|nr:NAD(P)-dependent oxidoreductase [Francisella philomiragia]MBK2267757.1 NAD(P)-dependent oxidoreductase [Francisella philomiragia]MBK2279145.1 NAD(P)-dependent oxidoreductase [Francisella philomiragia]MBK2287066.1 NAD(P)-dependent oxidoreductase [Francisella philomiragia]MBK2288977.1 NAD(P)-dependent oxidoreductase [Francisella philomiragia]MBK2290695.1 NAD(P)-dependent oxidoreductase [Francisella philomiragia]
MVVGGGQLAQAFYNYQNNEGVTIFASGVSDSSCIEQKEFDRERKLLETILKGNSNKKFVYFSSCALSAEDYPKNSYYTHKIQMESTIKKLSDKYFIIRLPQLFGNLKLHNTLINYIYHAIKSNNVMSVYSDAYRYVIEIEDVRKFVDSYLANGALCSTIDLANPYRYKILEIIEIFENLLNKKANTIIIQKKDKYILDLSKLNSYIKANNIDIEFGKDYLKNKLHEKIKNINSI